MSENRKKFLSTSVSATGKRQANIASGIANASINKRIKVSVEVEDVVTTEIDRDCNDVDIVDETVDMQMKRATWTFSRVTPHWIAWFLAFFLGAAAAPVDDEDTGKKLHTLTRSLSDDLPSLSFVDCFEDNLATAEKFLGHKVESISIQIPSRKNVTMTVVTVGRFATESVADFDLPDCETLPALKGYQCKIFVNGVDYTSVFWQNGLEFSNKIPTGEDAFPGAADDVQVLERGDQPEYTLSPQFLVKKGHALHTAAKNRSKLSVVVQFGESDSEHVKVTCPNTLLKLNSRWRQFVGELNRYSTLIDAIPMKDETLGTPLKVEAFLDQTTAFLTT